MADDTDRPHETGTGHQPASIGVVEVLAVPDIGAWTIRVTVAHADGPVSGWAPVVFWSALAGERWLADRSRQLLRPAVRRCDHGHGDLAYGAVLDADGQPVLVSEPLRRVKAAGVAALLAAELRART